MAIEPTDLEAKAHNDWMRMEYHLRTKYREELLADCAAEIGISIEELECSEAAMERFNMLLDAFTVGCRDGFLGPR